MARFERYVSETFEETWLISEADRNALRAACPDANLRVVPNGVDLERFRPGPEAPDPHRLVFVGHLGVFHNVDAAVHLVQDVLPLVRRALPEVTLHLVGADPSPAVRRLAATPGVEVTGFVPDLNAHLNRAAVFVAPLRFAAGVQNKVLEAMAAGRPVVASSPVNLGLGATPGEHLVVADGAPETARQIVRLLRDEEERARIGPAGRAFVESRCSWAHAVARVAAVEAELTPRSAGETTRGAFRPETTGP